MVEVRVGGAKEVEEMVEEREAVAMAGVAPAAGRVVVVKVAATAEEVMEAAMEEAAKEKVSACSALGYAALTVILTASLAGFSAA